MICRAGRHNVLRFNDLIVAMIILTITDTITITVRTAAKTTVHNAACFIHHVTESHRVSQAVQRYQVLVQLSHLNVFETNTVA